MTHTPAVMLGIALTLIVIAATLVFLFLRAKQRAKNEPFVNEQTVVTTLKQFKSDRYAAAGMRYFYTDDTSPTDVRTGAIFFHPSQNDIVCNMGSKDLSSTACDKTLTTLSYVTCADPTTTWRPDVILQECPEVLMSPNDLTDCQVRVMRSVYQFVKICFRLTGSVSTSGSTTVLTMPSSHYTTAALVLSRPVFVSGMGCKVMAPVYDPSAYPRNDGSNTMLNFDSKNTTPVVVNLQYVSDGVIMNDKQQDLVGMVNVIREAGKSTYQPPSSSSNSGTVVIPMVANYLNFMRSHPRDRGSSGNRVLTLYINMALPMKEPFNMTSPLFRVSAGGDAKTVTVSTAKGNKVIPATKTAWIIVTYTTTRILVASLDKDRILFRTYTGEANFTATDADVAKAGKLFPSPPAVYPYKTDAIPNFADVAIKLGFLA